MAAVLLDHVSKVFSSGVRAVRELCLEIPHGELLVLVGPSGCGKTTTLRLIAGLEDVSSGRICLAGREVTRLPPRKRDIAMVFQTPALYPHLNIAQNLAFGLKLRRTPRSEIRRRVRAVADTLAIGHLLRRRPSDISGGQRQRVALGRAIARRPAVYLLDEPLSSVDARLRDDLRAEIKALHRRLGATTIFVTHDQAEAMTLGDRIAVMGSGILQQWGTPLSVYRSPANRFVAGFLGSPPMNFFEGRIESTGSAAAFVANAGFQLPLAADDPSLWSHQGRPVVLAIRPHDLSLGIHEPGDGPAIRARVERIELLGPELHVRMAVGQDRFVLCTASHVHVQPGDLARVVPSLDRIHLFDPSSGSRIGLCEAASGPTGDQTGR